MAVTTELIKIVRERSGAGMLDCKKALEACDCDVDKACDWLREKGIAKAAKKASRIAAEGVCSIKVDGNKAVIIEVNTETDFAAKSEVFTALVADITNNLLAGAPANLEAALALEVNGTTIDETLKAATGQIGEKLSLRRVDVLHKTDAQSFGSYIHMGGSIGTVVVVDGEGKETVAKDIAMHAAASNPSYITRDDVPASYIENETHIQMEAAKVDPKLQGKPENVLKGIVAGKVNKSLSEICLVEQPFVKDPSVTVAQYAKNNGAAIVAVVRYGVGEGIEKRQENFADEVMKQIKG